MMRAITFLLFICTTSALAQTNKYTENEISDYIQSLIGGQREVSVQSGRIDLVHDSVAYEIEWANKWKHSIGQSLWYALQSNNKPGIILILKKKGDYKYFIQLNTALEYAKLSDKIKVYLFPNDFKQFMER